jgi:hypothetical protein
MSTNTATSPHMERIIRLLAEEYGVDLSQQGAQLTLEMPTRSDCWLIANLDGTRISLTRCFVEEGDCLAPVLDMVFALTPHGWEPLELLYADEVWDAYVQAAKAAGTAVYDDKGNTLFGHFTEYWAQQLQAQGWLTHSRRLLDAFWPLANDERAVLGTASGRGRMAGCQSTNHDQCYGELWQCAACGKTVCYAEGTDDHPELCDDCWVKHYGAAKEDDDLPF